MSWEIRTGDCRALLPEIPAGSVQCVVTSPPYFGLRDYGVAGQLGLESTPAAYIATLVGVFREVRRALRDDGTLWLNLGDSYAANRPYQVPSTKGGAKHGPAQGIEGRGSSVPPGLKPKDLCGIPWRVALALQEDGWYLRSDIVWHKLNPMPESVTDRPTRAHEYVFLLAKSERYYYDASAIAERAEWGGRGSRFDTGKTAAHQLGRTQAGARSEHEERNRRSVWPLATARYHGAHFATMPPGLVEPCIKAGCPAGGVVLDPFTGAGTVGLMATRLGRSFIGLELNPAYADMARRRIEDDAPLLNRAGGAA